MNTPQRKFFLCIWHWQCPKIFPGNLNLIKKSKGCMNGVTSRVGKRWQNVYKSIMKSEKYSDIPGVLELSTEVLFAAPLEGRIFTAVWETRNRYCQNHRPSCKISPTYHCSWLCWLSCRELTWSSSVGLQSPRCIWCWSSSTSRSTRARAATSKDGVTFSSNNKL